MAESASGMHKRATKRAKAEQPSRERFIGATAELLQTRGYYGTSLNEILALSGAPRGSLYYHFPGGKDELAIAALQAAGAAVGRMLDRVLDATSDATAAIHSIFQFFRDELLRSSFQKGCPIAAIAQEVGSDHENVRTACQEIYRDWETRLVVLLERGRVADRSEQIAEPHPARMARLILCMLEGALLLAKSHRSVSYLDLTCDHVLEILR